MLFYHFCPGETPGTAAVPGLFPVPLVKAPMTGKQSTYTAFIQKSYKIGGDRPDMTIAVEWDVMQHQNKTITKTCPCNMQQFLKVEKMIIFR